VTITDTNPTGATAATSVMVVNATTTWRKGINPTSVRRPREWQDDHGGDAQHVAGNVVVTTADGTGILTDGFTL
jgi:hypothetical protein